MPKVTHNVFVLRETLENLGTARRPLLRSYRESCEKSGLGVKLVWGSIFDDNLNNSKKHELRTYFIIDPCLVNEKVLLSEKMSSLQFYDFQG